jgi:GT2 family glycosyltransferase
VRSSARIRANDWSSLPSIPAEGWDPHLSVTVVIPAYHAQSTIAYTLAALSVQSYPMELLEVVVVNDDAEVPLVLPDIRPPNSRVIQARRSWGRANACHEGTLVANGEVLHWLDADMVPAHDAVERQMWWHHQIDHAVVLGHKLFVGMDPLPPVEAVLEAVQGKTLPQLFDDRWTAEHEWVDKIWRRTSDLQTVGFRGFHVHVGATASLPRDLYASSGGMDSSLKLGEDIELGYRLQMKGAVFIADRAASSWHLGSSTLMRDEKAVQAYNAPFIAQRIPDLRKFRIPTGRTYKVPLIQATIRAAQAPLSHVKFSVDGVLQAVPSDVACVLLGPWSAITGERRSPLADPQLQQRLLCEEYDSESRVQFIDEASATAFPCTYRLTMPPGWSPGHRTMDELAQQMQKRHLGLISIVLSDGQVARFERTAAFERALLHEPDDLDDLVDAVAGTWWSSGEELGFLHVSGTDAPVSPGQPESHPSPGDLRTLEMPLSARRRRLGKVGRRILRLT